jgi:hypothetical protein
MYPSIGPHRNVHPNLEQLESRDLPSFLPPVDYFVGTWVTNPAVADFNGDGRSDVAAALNADGQMAILLGNGDGTFGPPTTYDASDYPYVVVAADLNGDARPDVLIGSDETGTVDYLVHVYLGNGDGTFQPPRTTTVTMYPNPIAVADFDADGRADMAIGGTQIHIFRGNGDGTFQNPVIYNTGPGYAAPKATDLNQDGSIDLVVAAYNANAAGVLLNRGDGTFKPVVFYPTGDSPGSLGLGDVNKDGRLDVVVGNGDVIGFTESTIAVLLGNGDGTFKPKLNFITGLAPSDLVLADFNRDRKLDVATVRYSPYTMSLLLGNGDGTFGPRTEYPNIGRPVVAVDLNFDRFPDLVARFGSSIRVSINDRSWGNPAPVAPPISGRSAEAPAPRNTAVGDHAAIRGARSFTAVAATAEINDPSVQEMASTAPPRRAQSEADTAWPFIALEQPFA